MADKTNVQSYDQFLTDLLSAYQAKTGVNDNSQASLIVSFFEVVALTGGRISGDIFQILRDRSVDRAEGDELRRIAADEKVREIPARVATGTVKITDTSFNKIATKVYAGTKAPNIGSTQIPISNATNFPASGSIYIGRGTANVEGPLSYTSITPSGSYSIINLSVPTNKFHNINESVILAQGGVRTIPIGTVVKAPASGATEDISFTVNQSAVILDGEVSVSNVSVAAQKAGISGNVPSGAIKEVNGLSFAAAVTNEIKFFSGRDIETDEELRIRIKRARLSKGLGTDLAIKNSVIGATPSDEQTSIVSSEIVRSDNQTFLYVDDNTGYEQKTAGVGLEYLVDSALGGEKVFQLETGGRQSSVVKAFIASNLLSPFDVKGSDALAITVGGVTTEHVFSSSDFTAEGAATSYEIVASINGNPALDFQAATTENGTKYRVFAKSESNENIQIASPSTSGRDVAVLTGMPSNEFQTIRLFKNKQPLSKDGQLAQLFSENQTNWSNLIANGDTITVAVDNTAPITYTILDADFINEGTYPSVSANNSLESWINVLNAKVTGATFSIIGDQIAVSSNLDRSSRAKIEIDPSSSLVTKGMFTASQGLLISGKDSDFTFSVNTAQITLTEPLSVGDELTVGSFETEARLESVQILGGSLTFSSDAYLWFVIDDLLSEAINTGLATNSILNVSKPSANILRFDTTTANAFSTLQVGDYVIVWSPQVNASNRLEARVNAVTATSFDIKITPAEFASAVAEAGLVYQEGISFSRTSSVPLKLKIASGTKTLSEISTELTAQTKALSFSVLLDEKLVIKTSTRSVGGSLQFITANQSASVLGFLAGSKDVSKDSLVSFYETDFTEGSFPLFAHSSYSAGTSANPPDSFISSASSVLNLSIAGFDPNLSIGQLQPFGSILDTLSPKRITIANSVAGSNIGLKQDSFIKRLRASDRYYVASNLDFGHGDNLVIVLDDDTTNKTFDVPLFREAVTNTTLAVNPTSFNAYDVDGGPTNPFSTFFGTAFKFDNFKVLMQAKNVMEQNSLQDALLFRAVSWGRSGERINVGYIYPTVPNASIQHTAVAEKDLSVRLSLKSGASVITNIDGTTEWNVTITPNTPVAGVDQVTYTWSGVGSNPNLVSLVGGEYVNINDQSELSLENTGVFRVSTEIGFLPTGTSFTVVRKNGEALAETNKATLSASALSFYLASATTVSEINSYVNSTAGLNGVISSSILNDGGISGSGVISKSTLEYTNFLNDSIYLLDGINWISTTNLGASPQFVLKSPLSFPTATGYAFNQGEVLRLVPTSIEQVARFTNILSVTGLTTLGEISLVSKDSKLEISTNTVGGSGSVQIVGGQANSASAVVSGASNLFENQYVKTEISSAGILGFHSDQYVKLTAANKQKKNLGISSSSVIKLTANSPSAGKSFVELFNKQSNERFFGNPRHHVRSEGRTFRVEKQGNLVCISWDGTASSPAFAKTAQFNSLLGGTYNIEKISNTSNARLKVLTGDANFADLSIGDIVTFSNMDESENNGDFIVLGISSDAKEITYINPNAINELSSGAYFLNDNIEILGDTFTVGGISLVEGVDFVAGFTLNDTAQNLSAAISALPNVSSEAIGSIVFVYADNFDASIAISYTPSGLPAATVSSASLVGNSFVDGDFSSVLQVSEGDTVTLSSPFNVLNRGQFKVIRRFNDSIYIDNVNAVEEDVLLPANTLSGIYTLASSRFDVTNNGRFMKVSWNGVGAEPFFGNIKAGTEVTMSTDFSFLNSGTFMIAKAEAKKQQITKLTASLAADITTGQYFLIYSANNASQYYVWFNKAGGGGDPMVVGFTPIQVNIGLTDTKQQVADAMAVAIDAVLDLEAVSDNGLVTVTTTDFGPATDAADVNVGGDFSAETVQSGQLTFFEAVNPLSANESNIIITTATNFRFHQPQILFSEYEATVAGDLLRISTDVLGTENIGSFVIEEVLSENTAVLSSLASTTEKISLAANEASVFVEEKNPYVGYKKIRSSNLDPANPDKANLVFDSRFQFEKINESANISVSGMSKLGFSTLIKKGLDSYRYHTGLIGEANRIVYGEPRDSITYAGVAASGSEIYIRESLIRRVKVSISVRLETGIPYSQIVEQVRTNVSALINGNPLGQSIAISDIVSAVNSIQGVNAVSIASPLYNTLNDTIRIGPEEKSRVLDLVSDIQVSQVG